ncbi:hypothetical protein BDQ12DRAFT_691781 [Crucibulum laeve]|uniref:F-box domain-containing protein n=1 Tax=Crucibulum laeve TaxID=68775 RepID=A0A5C3LJW1_9AGAR|nr:hypothetical protein BDQ12DRAFT_691781 [Crucibulum laeve]
MVLNLLDLPTEILLHVLGHLSTRERYNLALTCHVLNVISIQIYLRAYHIPYPGSTANIRVTDWSPAHRARTSELDALYALSITLDLKEMEDFTCHLDGPSFDRKHLDFVARKVRRLTRFIERLERVQKVHLYLDWDTDYSPPDDSFRILDTQLEDWARTSESLFNTIIEKGCTDLTVQYGAYMQDAYDFRLIPIVARPISSLEHSVRRRMHSTGSALAISYGSGWEYF